MLIDHPTCEIITLVEVDTQPLIVGPRLRLAESKRASFVFQISRATLIRAGIKLHLFTSCTPALQNYKKVYFDILRALRERQDLISDSDNLKGTNVYLWFHSCQRSLLTCGCRTRQPAVDASLDLACDTSGKLTTRHAFLS
jgi:hypothetical protein